MSALDPRERDLTKCVDLEKVYSVAHDEVPALLECLAVLIPALERDVGWAEHA